MSKAIYVKTDKQSATSIPRVSDISNYNTPYVRAALFNNSWAVGDDTAGALTFGTPVVLSVPVLSNTFGWGKPLILGAHDYTFDIATHGAYTILLLPAADALLPYSPYLFTVTQSGLSLSVSSGVQITAISVLGIDSTAGHAGGKAAVVWRDSVNSGNSSWIMAVQGTSHGTPLNLAGPYPARPFTSVIHAFKNSDYGIISLGDNIAFDEVLVLYKVESDLSISLLGELSPSAGYYSQEWIALSDTIMVAAVFGIGDPSLSLQVITRTGATLTGGPPTSTDSIGPFGTPVWIDVTHFFGPGAGVQTWELSGSGGSAVVTALGAPFVVGSNSYPAGPYAMVGTDRTVGFGVSPTSPFGPYIDLYFAMFGSSGTTMTSSSNLDVVPTPAGGGRWQEGFPFPGWKDGSREFLIPLVHDLVGGGPRGQSAAVVKNTKVVVSDKIHVKGQTQKVTSISTVSA